MVKRIRPHYITHNKIISIPTEHLFLDIESELVPRDDKITEHTIMMGWACYWRRRPERKNDTEQYTFFTTVPEILAILESSCHGKTPLHVITHNLSYDFGVTLLFEALNNSGWETTSFYSRGMTSIITFAKDGRKIRALDNGNVFPGSLGNLGDAIKLPKMIIDFEKDSWEGIKAYCRRDVEIMVEARKQYYAFILEHDLGGVALTVPSQAWRAWRHRFMDHRILIHGNATASEMERASYRGGRCSVFWKGERNDQTYTKLDVNSMYPYVMEKYDYPTVLVKIDKVCSLERLVEYLLEYCVVAEVEVEASDPVYPVRYRGRNVYPVGTFWTTLTTPEILYALDNAELRHVRRVAVYQKAPIFRSFVNYMYPLKVRYKEEQNGPYYHITKLMQNGLYGRCGMLGHKWAKIEKLCDEEKDVDVFRSMDPKDTVKVYRFGSDIWTSEETGETDSSFAAIPAHVTAHARLYLHDLRIRAGLEHVLYCDTDSLIVDEQGADNLGDYMDPVKLGALKVEEQAQTVYIGAPKFYRLGEHWKRKGVSKKATLIDAQTFEQDRFPSFLTQGSWPPGTTYTTERIRKHFTLRIYDGSVDPHGWVHPLKASDLTTEQIALPEMTIEETQAITEIETLRSTKTLPPSIMIQLWDYVNGEFKKARNGSGNLVALEYSKWDGLAADYGLSDVDGLMNQVTRQLRTDEQIGRLKSQLPLYQDTIPDSPPIPPQSS